MEKIQVMLLIVSFIFISGCNDIGFEQKPSIDFSDPIEQISVPPKNAKVYSYGKDIAVETGCKGWDTYQQRDKDTNSMDPTFDAGHIILACRLDGYEPRIGDIVVFDRKPGYPITHRIIDIQDNNYTIKGDNLDDIEYINRSQITHYVLGVIY